MLELKQKLKDWNIAQAELARRVNLSEATIAQWLNKEIWPTKPDLQTLKESVGAALAGLGREVCAAHFETAAGSGKPAAANSSYEDMTMLLDRRRLTQQARKHFNLNRDPFDNEIQAGEDVFLTKNARAVRETMRATAKFGGFLAVVGESGSGKTTLMEDLEQHLIDERAQIVLIRPSVVGMEQDDASGKRLKAASILDSIMRRVNPDCGRRGLTLEEKACRALDVLQKSHQSGFRHCLLIEEAHRLAVPTLRHLKSFIELKIGRQPLLSVILIGQPELGKRLQPQNYDLREVIQRCEVVNLAPLDAELEGYVAHKFARAGVAASAIMEPGTIDAIRAKLLFAREGKAISLIFPLVVNNILCAAMNQAVDLGLARLSADLIREVR